jgi:excisionase family DNA binding protein
MTRLYSVANAAKRLDYSREHVYRLVRSGRLRAVRLEEGAPWRIPEDALEELIASMDTNRGAA